MDYGRLLTDAWKITWRTKYLWLLGFLASLGQGLGSALGIWSNNLIFAIPENGRDLDARLEQWFNPANWRPGQVWGWLIGGTLALFFLLLVYWLLVAWADGAIIGATLSRADDHPITFLESARLGRRYLGRFIVIDAVVFLPLFVIVLLIMLVAGGAVVGSAFTAVQSTSPDAALNVLAIAGIILVPLLCLTVPAGILTSIFRTLAFRQTAVSMSPTADTAMYQNSVRAILRQTWQVVRRRWSSVFLVAILLWALTYVLRMVASMAALPMYFLAVLPMIDGGIFPGVSTPWLMLLVSSALSLGTTAVLALVHAYTAVVWTLAYREFAAIPPSES